MLQGKMAKSKTQEGIESMARNVRNKEIIETEQVGTKRIIIKAGTILLIAKSETEETFAMSLVRFLLHCQTIGNASLLSCSFTQIRGYFKY